MNDQNALEIERQRLQERYDEQPDSRVFAPLADCLRKLGRLQEALGVCHTGLAKHPRYSSAYVILGKIHLGRGDDGAASEAFERVLEFDPQNLLALRQLAELDEVRSDDAAAVERWELVAALEIDPGPAEERLEAARSRLEGVAPPREGDTAADATPADVPEETMDSPEVDENTDDIVAGDETETEESAFETVADEELAGEEGEEITDVEPPAEASETETETDVDHALVGDLRDRTGEVLEKPEEPAASDDESTVPEGSSLLPYVGNDIAVQPDDDIEDDDNDDIEDDDGSIEFALGAEATVTTEEAEPPVASGPVRPVDDEAIPTTEIATTTLAEIYAEQGFAVKALEILRQVLERNPGAETVARRIAELEAAPPAAEPEPPAAPEAATPSQPDADVQRALDTEPITLSADEAPRDDLEGPEVEPAPPLTARTSPESEEEDERERYGHFRSWLDRIRVDD